MSNQPCRLTRHQPYTISRGLPIGGSPKLAQLRRLKREFDHADSRYSVAAQRMIEVQCEKLHYRLYRERCSYRAIAEEARQRSQRSQRQRLWRYIARFCGYTVVLSSICVGLLWAAGVWPLTAESVWKDAYLLGFVVSAQVSTLWYDAHRPLWKAWEGSDG